MRPHLQLFIDVPEASWSGAVSFWTAATGWPASAPRGEAGQFVTLEPPGGDAWLKMQAVPGPGGVHLDLDSDDRPAQVERALELGATRAWTYHDVPVMRSPGGFVFCHTLRPPGRFPGPPRSGSTVADQVCLDVPATHWETEVAFWAALTGRDPAQGSLPEFISLADPDAGLRILLQRLGEEGGRVRGHVDFATTERPQTTDRHVALGASVMATHPFWTVLLAPGGQVYCLTDRDPATGRRSA